MRVGDYRLLTLLGEGGMGVVHLAEGPDGRRVAVKVLRPHVIGDREARDRLAREVASLERVRSARIAEFLDADPYGEVPFVVTRYVPGLPLHRHVEQHGPLDEEDLRHFARTLAEGLDDVHRAGVLHRDIKPANILLEGRSPVLIDFGLARVAEDARITQTGFLLGTPGYLAPEVLHGDEPTPASDVHSWAATVVYAATGRPPYGTGPSLAVLDRVRRGEHDLTGVPESLQPLLHAALDVEPIRRPTVLELRQALAVPTAEVPGQARPRVVEDLPTMPLVAADPTTRIVAATGRPDVAEPATTPVTTPPELAEPVTEPPTLWPDEPASDEVPEAWQIAAEPRDSRPPGRGVLLAWGLAAAALVALAPYLGAALLAFLAGLLRFASVTRQRHRRRRELRGRARWYDAPVSTVSTPGYLLLSLGGTLVLVGWAVASAVATAGILMLLRPALPIGLFLVGAVYALGLWWGPASARVREMTRMTAPRSPLVMVLGVALAIALLGALVGNGPIWSPQADAPWLHGVLRQLVRSY